MGNYLQKQNQKGIDLGQNSNLQHFQKRLVMLGDSTLDNIVWVNKYEKCIKSQLEKSLKGIEIINYAADGYTSLDMITGNQPDISYQKRKQNNDPFPIPSIEDKFKPLEHLSKLKPKADYAVLSVGGNDIREILGNMSLLQERLNDLFNNYPAIVDKIKSENKNLNLIIMLQYRPSYVQKNYRVYEAMEKIPGEYSSVSKLNRLLEMVYNQGKIMQLAQKYKIPIVDLSNSFDIEDNSMYVSQIEPSENGGKLISELISHIIQKHDFSGNSYLYSKYKNQEIQQQLNPSIENKLWSVNI